MNKKTLILMVLTTVLLFVLSACSTEKEETNFQESLVTSDYTEKQKDLFAMDTYMTFKAYGTNADQALNDTVALISDLEDMLSVTNADSAISKVNAGNGTSTEIPDTVVELVKEAQKISSQTEGAFDISIYPVLKAWGFTTEDYQVPTTEELNILLQYVDYRQIVLNTENNTITLPKNMQIDLGGIAKGYAGQKAVESLKAQGIESALLNMGGNIQTVGSKPDGSDWTVAIQDPERTGQYIGYVRISDKAVVTSGGYERYFEDKDGHLWWHIMNPKTGYSAKSGLLSVSVIGDDGMLCDVLSTALFVMGLDKASTYWKTYGGFEAVFVTENSEIYITEGLKSNFQTMNAYKDKKVYLIK